MPDPKETNVGQDNTSTDVKETESNDKETLLGETPKGDESKDENKDEKKSTEEKKKSEKDEGDSGTQKEDAEKDKKPGEDSEESDAPTEYTDFTLPDGMTLNEELKGEFIDIAKKHKLSQEGAQAFIDLSVKNLQQAISSQERITTETREGWRKEIKIDKEFGGEKFNETAERAIRARDKFSGGSDGFREMLNESGIGDHPEMIKYLARVDKAFGEDRAIDGDKVTPPLSRAEILYPNQGKN